MTVLDDLVTKTNKKLGSQVLLKGSDLRNKQTLRTTSGSLAFDLMLGGGWPLNCFNEVIGMESNGKTVLALKTIAANQKLNKKHETLWIASEPFVWVWAETLGVDLNRIVVAETNVMEEAYQIVVDHLEERAVDAVIIDSYPALIPTVEDEKMMDEMTVGLGAKLTNQFMRKSGKASRRSLVAEDRPCLAIMINQWRDKIGGYGDPRTTPGGKGKNFAAFTRVEVSREEWIEETGKNKVGLTIKARTIKNKTAPPQRTGSVDFYFTDGCGFHAGDYDHIKEISNLAIAMDVIDRAGPYYRYDGHQWRGKDAFLDELRQDLDLQKKVSKDCAAVSAGVLKQPVETPVSALKQGVTAKPETPVRKLARGK